MEDLIYGGADIETLIKTKYPNAKITDASNNIYVERFEVDIPDVTDDEFYPFAINEGFARCCLSIEVLLQSLRFLEGETIESKENRTKIERWLEIAKAYGGKMNKKEVFNVVIDEERER